MPFALKEVPRLIDKLPEARENNGLKVNMKATFTIVIKKHQNAHLRDNDQRTIDKKQIEFKYLESAMTSDG